MAKKQTTAQAGTETTAASEGSASLPQSLVSERAIAQRVNRALAKRGQKLIKSKGPRQVAALGEWHIADERQGGIVSTNVSLADLARQEGLLQPWEGIFVVADAGGKAPGTPSTYHPVIGYVGGTLLRAAGGLTREQAIEAASVLADQTEHDDEIDFIGAGLDRTLTTHVER